MPEFTDQDFYGYLDGKQGRDRWNTIEYAEEAEVLKFAQKLRAAGNAEPLNALMPSLPKDSAHCLIANALNYESRVMPLHHGERQIEGTIIKEPDGWVWVLVPNIRGLVDVDALAESVDCEAIDVWAYSNGMEVFNAPLWDSISGEQVRAVKLPKRIGNSARAFDCHEGWTEKYNKYQEQY